MSDDLESKCPSPFKWDLWAKRFEEKHGKKAVTEDGIEVPCYKCPGVHNCGFVPGEIVEDIMRDKYRRK